MRKSGAARDGSAIHREPLRAAAVGRACSGTKGIEGFPAAF